MESITRKSQNESEILHSIQSSGIACKRIGLDSKPLKNANKKATWTNPNCKTKIDLKILIPFVDKASNNTKDVEANDITKLQKAGLADEDIVRLCQLIAFVSFQIRVITGLELLNEGKNE